MTERKKPFYGWAIVTAATFVMMSVYGVVNNCYAFYIEPVTAELGFSRQGYSFTQSILFIALMLVAPFAGRVYRRFDLMKTMRLSTALLIASYAAYGLSTRLWQFYLLSAVIGVCECFITTIPISIVIRNWFESSYGLALGIALMGSGVGGMIFSPVMQALISGAGWRITFFAVAAIMAVINLFAVFIIMKGTPEEMGLKPFRNEKKEKNAREAAPEGGSLASTLGSPRFYAVMALAVLFAACSYTLCTYIAPYYSELGHNAGWLTFCASAAMGGMAVGKIVFGRLIDRLGLKASTAVAMASLVIGFIGMLFSKNMLMFALVFFGVALGCPFGTVAPAIVVRDVFGTRDFGSKLGVYSAAANLGAAISPFFGGAVYDATGGYYEAMVICLFISAGLFIGYLIILPGRGKARQKASQQA